MNDSYTPQRNTQKTPDYYNPHNITLDPSSSSSLLMHEPQETKPEEEIQKRYPIKTIIGAGVILIMVLAIPVGVYLNQKPTEVFIEATTPTPTPTDTTTQPPFSS